MASAAHPLSSLAKVTPLSIETQNSELVALVSEQEAVARFSSFSYDTAWTVGSVIRALFLERYDPAKAGIAVRIETGTGHVLFSVAVGNAPAVGLGNWSWVQGKSNVVKKLGKSSLRVGRECAAKGRTPEMIGLPFPEYACHGGGFPIFVKGVDVGPLGAITVSGLEQREDHQLIVDALVKCSHLLA